MYVGISHIYLLYLFIWIIFLFYCHPCPPNTIMCIVKRTFSLFFFGSSPYISNLYILDQKSRLPYQKICIAYVDCISNLLVCGNFSLTSRTGRCWNLLESYPYRIPLTGLSHKWNRILFIIYNTKIGIWLCIQPTIYVNSQYNLYICSNSRPYNNMYQNLSTLKSSWYKN